MEKLSLTQPKHAFTKQKKCIATRNKAGFGLLLRHPAWKRSGSILKGEDKYGRSISKEKGEEKKDKCGSIRYKQANNIFVKCTVAVG